MAASIFDRVKALNFPPGEYAVFGSGLLEAWGLRKAKDADLIVTPELYERLKLDGWEEHHEETFTYLTKEGVGGVEIGSDLNQEALGSYRPDKVRLIREAIMIKGVPFVRAEEIIAVKRVYDRPKDHADIKLLEDYLKRRPGARR